MGKKERKALSSAGNAVVKGTTGGAVSIDGTGWGEKIAKGENVGLEDFVSGIPGMASATEAQKMMTPDIKIPKAPDMAAQEDVAAEIAKKKAAELGKGVSATILGGSIGDSSNLRKKKLLGE